MNPRTKREAREIGARHFFTGRPCKNGHVANRFASNGFCTRCRHSDPVADRLGHVRRQYGLTARAYQDLKDSTGGTCPICGRALTFTGRSSPSRAVVDHCHTTGQVRGIICHPCNSGLGRFGDDPSTLRLAASYLEQRGH